MEIFNDIDDNQIRVLGTSDNETGNNEHETKEKKPWKKWLKILGIICLSILGLILLAAIYMIVSFSFSAPPEEDVIEDELGMEVYPEDYIEPQGINVEQIADNIPGYCEVRDTMMNDIQMKIYIPHNAVPTLHVGKINYNDAEVVYAAQAADYRADNGKILGAYVLKGKPLAWGLTKKGYCAIIDGKVTVGVADNSPLFEEATATDGYFFRQFPLVEDGKLYHRTHKGKSFRRAICDFDGNIIMIETLSQESMHDFSQALVDLGADQAIYLTGGSTYGWAVDAEGVRHEFGIKNRRPHRNINYIVWRRKK